MSASISRHRPFCFRLVDYLAVSAEARTYFDRYLDYRQLARYYLSVCIERPETGLWR